MTFPAHPYEVDEHLVAGLRALYSATDSLRRIPLAKLDVPSQLTVREAIGRVDAIKDALYLVRQGKERTDDTPPVDLIGYSAKRGIRGVTKRIYELLADGEWHDYDTVVREAAKEVLPGEAHRYMEDKRKLRVGEDSERTKNTDDVYLVERGQRACTVSTIAGNERIEMEPRGRPRVGEQRWVRLRPSNLTRTNNGQVAKPVPEPVADPAPDAPDGAEVTP